MTARVLVHAGWRRAVGLPIVAPVGWFLDEVEGAWWRLDLDGRCEPAPSLARPALRGLAARPDLGREPGNVGRRG